MSSVPWLFTKLMKAVFSHLRELGLISSTYLDDSLLVGYNYDDCVAKVTRTLHILRQLGLKPHEAKSAVTASTQVIQKVGFVLNSTDMTLSISAEKHQKLVKVIENTVELLYNDGPVLCGHPTLSGQFSKSRFFAHTNAVFVTCIRLPPCSSPMFVFLCYFTCIKRPPLNRNSFYAAFYCV